MLKKILKISFYTAISTLAVITTVAVYAAFIPPSDTPSTSVQDWIGNILGANNANNAASSASVTGNHDGSLLERAEDLRQTMAQNGYDSSFATANANGSVLQILKDIKASLGGSNSGFSNCEAKFIAPTKSLAPSTITCSSGKSIRSHNSSCGQHFYQTNYMYNGIGKCGITNLTTTSLTGNGDEINFTDGNGSIKGEWWFSASMICCDN